MRNARMPVHHFFNNLPYPRKTYLSIQERCDRHFIGCVQNRRQRAPRLARAAREIQRGEIVVAGRGKF